MLRLFGIGESKLEDTLELVSLPGQKLVSTTSLWFAEH